jgi:hypothetical protein
LAARRVLVPSAARPSSAMKPAVATAPRAATSAASACRKNPVEAIN